MRYPEVWPQYARWWDAMVIKTDRVHEFTEVAKYAVAHRDQYIEVEKATGLPWPMVAVIHWREGSGNFHTYLGNGQLLSHRTTIVPVGRGPFASFLAGAIDSVKVEGWGGVQDWRLEKMLYYEMLFNGTGYGADSPYIWGGTNIQRPGKYIRDHVFDPHVWDTQPGTAPIMWMIAKLDPTVQYARET